MPHVAVGTSGWSYEHWAGAFYPEGLPRTRWLEAIPIFLDFCHTRLARGDEAAWIRRRFIAACDELGTQVQTVGDRLVIEWASQSSAVRQTSK